MGSYWFRLAGTVSSVQRVIAYNASPGVGIPNANDPIAEEADRGISEIEAFLADAALATV